MINAGDRDRLIVIERAAVTVDDYGGEDSVWTQHARAWARVRYGSGQERREAAQEFASQAATFECLWNPSLDDVGSDDRIIFDGAAWDITNRALIGLNREIHFTASTTWAGAAETISQRLLTGSAAGQATATATLTIRRLLAGAAAAVSAATGTITTRAALAGTAAAVSSLTGTLSVSGTFSGSAVATSSAEGLLTVRAALTGTAAGTSSASGEMLNEEPAIEAPDPDYEANVAATASHTINNVDNGKYQVYVQNGAVGEWLDDEFVAGGSYTATPPAGQPTLTRVRMFYRDAALAGTGLATNVVFAAVFNSRGHLLAGTAAPYSTSEPTVVSSSANLYPVHQGGATGMVGGVRKRWTVQDPNIRRWDAAWVEEAAALVNGNTGLFGGGAHIGDPVYVEADGDLYAPTELYSVGNSSRWGIGRWNAVATPMELKGEWRFTGFTAGQTEFSAVGYGETRDMFYVADYDHKRYIRRIQRSVLHAQAYGEVSSALFEPPLDWNPTLLYKNIDGMHVINGGALDGVIVVSGQRDVGTGAGWIFIDPDTGAILHEAIFPASSNGSSSFGGVIEEGGQLGILRENTGASSAVFDFVTTPSFIATAPYGLNAAGTHGIVFPYTGGLPNAYTYLASQQIAAYVSGDRPSLQDHMADATHYRTTVEGASRNIRSRAVSTTALTTVATHAIDTRFIWAFRANRTTLAIAILNSLPGGTGTELTGTAASNQALVANDRLGASAHFSNNYLNGKHHAHVLFNYEMPLADFTSYSQDEGQIWSIVTPLSTDEKTAIQAA